MFEFLKNLRAKQAEKVEDSRKAYRELIAKAAANGGKLNASDEKKIAEVMQALGIGPEQVEADVDVLVRIAALEPLAAEVEKRRAAQKLAGQALADHLQKREATLAALDAKTAELTSARGAATTAFAEAARAVDELAALKKQHARMLGLPVEDESDKLVRCIVHITREMNPSNTGTRFLSFSALLYNPTTYGDLGRYTFVPADGQDKEQVEYFLDVIRRGPGNFAFLVSKDNKYPLLTFEDTNRLIFIENILESEAPANPGNFNWIRHPGQTQDELDRLVARARKHYSMMAEKFGRTASRVVA